MSSIQESLFATIETITNSKINQLKFDKTIEAIVMSADKASSGEYEVRYQDLTFIAYSSNNTVRYSKDENVLVLIPDGNFNGRKTILSSNKRQGESFIDVGQVIDRMGVNLLDEDEDFQIKLPTTSDLTVRFNIKDSLMVTSYPGQKYLAIGAEIIADINDLDRDGLYGIAIDCEFINKQGEKVYHSFEFNTNHITGNPFKANGLYKETRIPLLEETLNRVVSARAYSAGFSQGNGNIILKNIIIEYVDIRETDRSEYSGNILTPDGVNFRNGVLYPDEKLDLVMEFKQQGKTIDTEGIAYYWLIPNADVSGEILEDGSADDRFFGQAGPGWELLKDENYLDLIEGASTKNLRISSSFVPNFINIKCMANFIDRGVFVSDMVSIVDHTDQMTVDVNSSNGVGFVNGVGSTELSCIVYQNGNIVEDADLSYDWVKIGEDGSEIPKTGNGNKLNINASEIGTNATYVCKIINKQDKVIAKGSITLVNVVDGTSQGVSIIGGFRTLLYDADGNAPNQAENPLSSFQFEVYDNGEVVSEDKLEWTWKIPSADSSLLRLAGTDDENETTTNTRVLSLKVADKFDLNKNNNTITLEVKYTKQGGVISFLRDYANIAITKIGTSGAEGPRGQAGKDGEVYIYEIQEGCPVITYNESGTNPKPSTTLPEFVLMLSKDGGGNIANEISSVSWTIPSSATSLLHFADGNTASSTTKITTQDAGGSSENPHRVVLTIDENWSEEKYNNYLKASFSYAGRNFVETYPISVIKNGSGGINITTNPSSYLIETDDSGEVLEELSILLNFDIFKGNIKEQSFRILRVTKVPSGMRHSIQSNATEVLLTFEKGNSLPNNGLIEIEIQIDGETHTQTFTFGKIKKGDSPYLLSIQSLNGFIFGESTVSTILTATVMKGTKDITKELPIGTRLIWEKYNEDGVKAEDWIPNIYNNEENRIVVAYGEFNSRATFNCSLILEE